MGSTLQLLGIGNDFLNRTPKAQKQSWALISRMASAYQASAEPGKQQRWEESFLGCHLAVVQSSFLPCSSLWGRNVHLCLSWKSFTFFFDLYRAHSWVCLESQGRLWTWTFGQCRNSQDLGAQEHKLSELCGAMDTSLWEPGAEGYSLDHECPQSPCVRGLFPRVLLEGGESFKKWTSRNVFRSWGCARMRTLEP